MDRDFSSEFTEHLFERLLAAQREFIAMLLKCCKPSYSAEANAFTIEANDRLAEMLYAKADKFVIPTVLSSSKILIRSPSRDIEIRREDMTSSTANAITEIEAITAVNDSELAAAIFLFAKHGLRPLHANSKASVLLRQPLSEILADKPALLVRYSDNAMKSLNELESLLLRYGSVEEFELVSEKANGDRGIYVVDATYVKWAGMDARLTLYRAYSLLSKN